MAANANKDSTVVIVGSGFAGLSAATALKNAGWNNVKIIEARDYVGGRTFTKDIGGTGALVDIGAAWIHGDKDNPLCAMCDHYGVSYIAHPEMKSGAAAVVDTATDDGNKRGERWTAEEAEILIGKVAEVLAHAKPGVSLTDAIHSYFAEAGISDSKEQRRLEFMVEQFVSGVSGPANKLHAYYPLNGLTGRLAEGYDQLIIGGYNALIDKIKEGLDIKLRTVVEKIEHVGDQVKISCKDGTIETADYCILTVPLGVLKKGSIEFSPPLPEDKVAAISKLDMGNYEKVIMVFEEKFWDPFIDLQEYKDGSTNIMLCNDFRDGKRSFPVHVDISGKLGTPCIVSLYDGAFSRHAQATMTDDEKVEKARTNLAIVLGKNPSDIPPCTATECTGWTNDEYACGGYSYFTVESKPEDMDVLAEPMYGGRLMFAGEATIKEHNATVHGPVISGLREALRLDESAFIDNVKPGVIPPPPKD